MKTKIICPSCKSNKVFVYLDNPSGNIYRCTICSLGFVFPIPDDKFLTKLYKKGYFEGEIKGVGGYANYESLGKNLESEAKMKLKLIKTYINKGELIDVGAGSGVFASIAKEQGFDVSANEISPFAKDLLRKKGLRVYFGKVKKNLLPKKLFNIVSAWDVIEHVNNPHEMVEEISVALKKGGFFFLTTPNTNSWDGTLLGKRWYGYKKLPEHLLFFNEKSIRVLLSKHGFEVIKIHSWGFVRNLGFISEKLNSYGKIFALFEKTIKTLGLEAFSLFFPMTDFLVVARKKI